MRSSLLVGTLAAFHFGGGGMHFDMKFMKPHDPVMDEVANILQGILSNLTKHKGYLQVDKDTMQRVKGLSPKDHTRLVGLLSEQISKLSSGGESFALDSVVMEHPELAKSARGDFKTALVNTVSAITKVQVTEQVAAPSLKELLKTLKVEAEGKAVLFVDDSAECAKYSTEAEKAAQAVGSGVVVVNATEVFAAGLVDRTPEMYFVPAKDGTPRRFTGEFSVEAVKAFVADHSEGTPDARRSLVAKSVRKEQAANLVVAVEPSALHGKMQTKGTDMFVTFYAPWCGHCKSFVVAETGTLNQLGIQLAHAGVQGKLEVLKMDVSSQPELPKEFGAVQFIPALFFVPADRSTAIAHSGAQDVPALIAFIESHAQSAKSVLAA